MTPAAALSISLAVLAAACSGASQPGARAGPADPVSEPGPRRPDEEPRDMEIRLTVDGRELKARMVDSPAARDFASLLPLTLTAKDLFRREKFARLPRALKTEGDGRHDYEVGDIVYWSPGPDVAVFYRHDGQEIPDPGVVVLGRVTGATEALDVPGKVEIRIERIQ